MRLFVDANIFVLAVLGKDAAGDKGDSARDLLDQIARGKHDAVTSVLVLDEVMWALSRAGFPELVEPSIRHIYELPHLAVNSVPADTPLVALRFIRDFKLRPRDALHCAFMESEGLSLVASDDADFDRVKEFERLTL